MKFSKQILNNGIRLVTIPMRDAETVTALVLVGAGSKYETRATNGVAHFLEHMMFKGTKKRPTALEISSLLDGVGAEYNAFTGKEYTGYYVKVADQHLELALDALSDSYQNSLFAAEEIEKERGVITEEINMYLDTPMRHIGDIWERLLYGDQPAGWSVAGEKENIARMRREDFLAYLKTHYTGPNTVVVVAGHFDTQHIKRMIEAYFGGIGKKRAGTKAIARDAQRTPAFRLERKKTDQTHIMVGVRAFDMFSERRHALAVLATVLGGGMSSRLFMEVREKRGLAYAVHASADAYTDTGYFVTQAGVRKEATAEALQVILAEYKKIAEKGVGREELVKAKNYMTGKMLLGLESSDEWAFFVGEQELLRRRIKAPDEIVRKINAVTAGDVQRIARDIFTERRLNAVVLGPFEEREGEAFRKMVHL